VAAWGQRVGAPRGGEWLPRSDKGSRADHAREGAPLRGGMAPPQR